MHSSALPISPLAVVHITIRLCTLASTALLLALVFALIEPVWSRAVLALQAVTLVVVGLAARWRPPRRVAIYALLLAGATLIWDPSLPPTQLPEEQVRHLLPLVVCAVVLADLLLRPSAPSFTPARVGVYAGLIDLIEAAWFFRSDPARLHAQLVARNARLVAAPDGSTLVALDEVIAALREHDSNGGPGPA
jgi:hypothetical protein